MRKNKNVENMFLSRPRKDTCYSVVTRPGAPPWTQRQTSLVSVKSHEDR